MISIYKIILDHEEYFRMKLLQATLSLNHNSTKWLQIRSNLEPKYKFTVDLDTFVEALGEGCFIFPTQRLLYKKGSSVVDLFVRYDFEHGQDAAVREMLSSLTERNRVEFYPSLTKPYINHRFASYLPPSLLGIIRLKAEGLSQGEIENLITNWDYIREYVTHNKLSYDSYHSFLESL